MVYRIITSTSKGKIMKRRSFLQAVALGVGYITLPALATTRSTRIYSAQSLKTAMEKMFICKEGEPTAFMELTRKAAKSYLTPQCFATIPKEYEIIRLIYQTFAYAIEGGSAIDAEAQLSTFFYEEFQKIADNKNYMLIWRREPHFKSEPITIFGNTFLTKEEIEDRVWKNKDYQPKVKVLGGDWTTYDYNNDLQIPIPVGVDYDFNTGSMRYVERQTMLHKMRMRLIVPEIMANEEYHSLAKPEATPIKRLGA